MNASRATIEIIAPTIEEAVEKGLSDLGLPQDAVDVEILDAGSRGLFGLGSRQARVRLIVRDAKVSEKTLAPASVETVAKAHAPEAHTPEEIAPVVEPPAAAPPIDEDDVLRVARETVSDLLDKMSVRA